MYLLKAGLPDFASFLAQGHLRRAQDLELKGTANEDGGHHGDNGGGHLLSWAHTLALPQIPSYLAVLFTEERY